MKLRLVIISVVCLSCLVPAVPGTHLLTKATVVKGGALLAKGALVKGLLAKGAVAKLAAIGFAPTTVPSKPLFVASKPITFIKPIYTYPVVGTPVPPQFPTVFVNHLHGLWGVVKSSLFRKAGGVADLISALVKLKTPSPVVYETVNSSQYAVPVVTKDKFPYP